jgi:hypothetical protein
MMEPTATLPPRSTLCEGQFHSRQFPVNVTLVELNRAQ